MQRTAAFGCLSMTQSTTLNHPQHLSVTILGQLSTGAREKRAICWLFSSPLKSNYYRCWLGGMIKCCFNCFSISKYGDKVIHQKKIGILIDQLGWYGSDWLIKYVELYLCFPRKYIRSFNISALFHLQIVKLIYKKLQKYVTKLEEEKTGGK